MKKYLPAISLLSLVTIVGAKFLMAKEYCLLSIAQVHGFYGAVRCLKLCDNLYCSLSQGYENFAASPGYFSYIVDSIRPTLF